VTESNVNEPTATPNQPQGAAPASPVMRALDLWGGTRSTRLQWVALLITGSFVLLEGRYNLDLLNTLIDPTASRETIDGLSNRGKLLAAIGLSWVCGRFLLERVRPALIGLALLVTLSFGVYQGLDHIYTSVIRDLPPAVKLKGFSLFSYRQDLLTGKLSDPDIPLPRDEPITGRLIMGSFPIVLLDDRFMLPARDIVERKANDKVRFVIKDAEAAWPDYNQQMGELQRGHQEFISGSRRAFQYKDMGGLDEFKTKSGGLRPDPSLTLNQFVDMLRQSDHPKGKALRDGEAKSIARRPDGTPVLAGEVPKFMNRHDYLAWFEQQVKAARDAALPTEKTVEQMAGIHDMNSAVFLPPMAMITSLTSALTNALTFVLLAAAIVARASGVASLQRVGRGLTRYGMPLTLSLFIVLLLAMPTHVFPQGPLHDLEDKMHRSVGVAGQVWSRLSNLQALLLRGEK
jgi:hypothetical protein